MYVVTFIPLCTWVPPTYTSSVKTPGEGMANTSCDETQTPVLKREVLPAIPRTYSPPRPCENTPPGYVSFVVSAMTRTPELPIISKLFQPSKSTASE
jgi:hypothetical protein